MKLNYFGEERSLYRNSSKQPFATFIGSVMQMSKLKKKTTYPFNYIRPKVGKF